MSRSSVNGANGKSLLSAPASPRSSTGALSRMNSTIRAVSSFDDRISEDSSTDTVPTSNTTSQNSTLSSSVNSSVSMGSASQDQLKLQKGESKTPAPTVKLRPSPSFNNLSEKSVSSLDVPRRLGTKSSFELPSRDSSLNATAPPQSPMSDNGGSSMQETISATEANLAGGWDSTIGKAGLGKTGRVINKLVSDNETLKRDIQIERLRAEESKNAAKLLEDKLERMVADYESRLLEANVTKTLLARKERQVASLQETVDLERKRAMDAGERERTWKDEMERVKADAKKQVDEATNLAALMEGRYNAISSHWKEQGEEVKRTVAKMRTEIASLLEERRRDDDRINTLRDLCDQQDGNIRELRKQKEDIAAQFERYKIAQDESLKDIKAKARQRELEQERALQETKEVLDKLKWALSVKEKIEWAQ
ncbi:hypothetical protein GE21DRAFT_1431 [Neurospora crassa]|uniref:SWI5-dependent HO expression protein 3 n=1 Tax=Neurospora crassa (strain ATCC 24698 / 74-OR23-1A / CBS 708.71 / DSM 1257 / FGSC 987) TaxID=367110 RepID=Q7S2M1_NEUCR|nr:hypothetical protein NCU09127 [Neurospora crassa OR74A]EAA29663.1 hypothetical protein NCU09127 [Neurospora crassa OR74A]KHE80603.1 hypothetical protein GE21DRAFT_1431 [Neurospora crassa]|eukprot:XP_958899.1 hypothetical protein NCU09127 [Neurospora crassa OR74A]